MILVVSISNPTALLQAHAAAHLPIPSRWLSVSALQILATILALALGFAFLRVQVEPSEKNKFIVSESK